MKFKLRVAFFVFIMGFVVIATGVLVTTMVYKVVVTGVPVIAAIYKKLPKIQLPELPTVVIPPQTVQTPVMLFKELSSQEFASSKRLLNHGAVVRNQYMRINPDQLKENKSGKLVLKSRIPLNLFANKNFTAILSKTEELSSGKLVGFGKLEEDPSSVVSMVVNGNNMVGHVYTNYKVYEIREAENGIVSVREIDPSKFPRDGHKKKEKKLNKGLKKNVPTAPFSMLTPSQQPTVNIIPVTRPTIIDVMVLYSDDARDAAGGQRAIEDLIDLSVADANLAYENSGVNQKLRLVHTEEVRYNETNDFELDLANLQTDNDGNIDNVFALRNQYGADMVTLFIADAADYCGLSDPMDDENFDDYADHAFSVIEIGCVSNLSYPHELGHGMGAQHDRATSDGAYEGLYEYSNGYQDLGGAFRTVMAYDCPRRSCVRLPFFSTPLKTNGRLALGTVNDDNARTLNNTRALGASLRLSQEQVATQPIEQKVPAAAQDTLARVEHKTEIIVDDVVALLPFASSSITIQYTQAFVPTVHSIEGVSFVLNKINSPTVSVRVALLSKDGNEIAYTSVLPSEIVSRGSVADPNWMRVNFRDPISVVSGASYRLKISVNRVNTLNNFAIGVGVNSYSSGALTSGSGVVAARDMALKIHYYVSLGGVKLP